MAGTRGEIDISRIPVGGIGGLGLVVMSFVVAYSVKPLRSVGLVVLVGAVGVALVLLASRHRELRRGALVLMAVLAMVLTGAVLKYLLW